jgi:hypothetical protein
MTDVPKKIRQIKQHIRGIMVQPAVVEAVDMLCDLVEELADVQVLVPELQEEVPVSTNTGEVLKLELPITENNRSLEADKATEVAETEREIEDEMSKEEKPKVKVISSAADAAAAIKKEKEAKKKMLENIFSDNKTGRYSGPTDS